MNIIPDKCSLYPRLLVALTANTALPQSDSPKDQVAQAKGIEVEF